MKKILTILFYLPLFLIACGSCSGCGTYEEDSNRFESLPVNIAPISGTWNDSIMNMHLKEAVDYLNLEFNKNVFIISSQNPCIIFEPTNIEEISKNPIIELKVASSTINAESGTIKNCSIKILDPFFGVTYTNTILAHELIHCIGHLSHTENGIMKSNDPGELPINDKNMPQEIKYWFSKNYN